MVYLSVETLGNTEAVHNADLSSSAEAASNIQSFVHVVIQLTVLWPKPVKEEIDLLDCHRIVPSLDVIALSHLSALERLILSWLSVGSKHDLEANACFSAPTHNKAQFQSRKHRGPKMRCLCIWSLEFVEQRVELYLGFRNRETAMLLLCVTTAHQLSQRLKTSGWLIDWLLHLNNDQMLGVMETPLRCWGNDSTKQVINAQSSSLLLAG